MLSVCSYSKSKLYRTWKHTADSGCQINSRIDPPS